MSAFLFGEKPRYEQRFSGGPEQRGLYNQLQAATQGRGAGGAFGQAADYYRELLGDTSQDFQAFAAPEQRRFREETIPDLAEQFAGMGSGALSSSGFRNAAVSAGADLGERLGRIRAMLRQQGAQGLSGLGTQGLGQFHENIYHPGKPGLLDQLSPVIGSALGAFGGPVGSAIGGAVGNWIKNRGSSSPYGDQGINRPDQRMEDRYQRDNMG